MRSKSIVARSKTFSLYCWICGDKNRAELAKLACTLDPNIHQVNAAPRRKEWSESDLQHTLAIARQNLLKDKAAQSFLSDRGIPLILAQSFALGCGEFYHEQRLCIPYLDGVFGENVLQLRYQTAEGIHEQTGQVGM